MSPTSTRSEGSTRIASSEIAMIADDLAGACDTGIEFLHAAGRVTVIIDSDDNWVDTDPRDGLYVWNTESRSLSPSEACRKVRRACINAVNRGTRIVVKKTDSAFRGAFGHEIAAVMEELHLDLCYLVPAIPAFGRVTRNGIQYIDRVPIAESFYRLDPKQPVTESQVAKIVAIGVHRPIGELNLDTLRSPEKNKHLERLIASGVHIIVADGESQADIEQSVRLFLQRPGRLLFVGGQGLGNALAKHCVPHAEMDSWTPVPQGGIVTVCGTLHPQTRKQIKFAARAYGIDYQVLHVDAHSTLPTREAEAEQMTISLLNQLDRFGVGFLVSPETPIPDPSLIETALAHVIEKTYKRTRLSALILTGGATAYMVCKQLGVKQLQLRQRISSGVVLTQAPDLSGMAIGIKGGSLGDIDAIQIMINTLQSRT
jgi:uncharacterized protein YgbK (DUF1537 family)